MKKILSVLTFISIFLFGCYKTDPAVLELLKQIQSQNEALKVQVAAMQKTTDSLAIALRTNTTTLNAMDKKIDSIRTQLVLVLTQINSLNTQLSQANANIVDIQAKLVALQATCDQLLTLLNQCCNIIPATLKDGLIAYYPFTGNPNDSSGNNNHGTNFGSILVQDRMGKPSCAYEFNGNDSYIKVPVTSLLSIPNNISITAWVYRKNESNITPEGIFGPANYMITNAGYYLRVINKKADLGISLPYTEGFSNSIIPGGKWVHLNASYNNNSIKIYINGVLDNETIVGPDRLDNWTSSNFLTIGQVRDNTTPTNFQTWNGYLDEIRIYNRELTKEEIAYLSSH